MKEKLRKNGFRIQIFKDNKCYMDVPDVICGDEILITITDEIIVDSINRKITNTYPVIVKIGDRIKK